MAGTLSPFDNRCGGPRAVHEARQSAQGHLDQVSPSMETRALAAAAVFGGAARREMDHARACERGCERGCERARCPSCGRGAPPQTQHFLAAGCWPKSSRRQGTQPLGIAGSGSATGAGEDGEDTAGSEGETPDGAAEGDGSSMVVVVIPMPSPEFSEQQQSIAKVEPEPQLSLQIYMSEVATNVL